MRYRKSAISGLLLACVLAAPADNATAALFSVSPIRVELDAAHRTSILTFSNSGHENLRMQVRAMQWSMAPDGSWQLAPSDDLIATPELLEIAPGQNVQLRIGSLADPGQSEASYRLLIDELPSLSEDAGEHKPEVKVLTQVSLPVYMEPPVATRVPVLRSAIIERGTLKIGIGDDGTQRLDAQGVQLSLADGAGRALLRRSQVANYVLAGSTDYLRVSLPAGMCERAASVTLAWPSMGGVTLTHPISRGGDPCRGAGLH
jgi:fimbrial chaperone protein